ncbi:SDR family oxidoreductase [Phycisphaera mikurensis]|uniref:Putative oxidoreductase n=1 Tax=Phycisphaera mikurensis (strain NBRC 102666 / KCTC 22515 / FYK2301M01) TaxID=1142394 RepID=I0IGA0_PHYMF|nr:SDR family oxidoreductase [Phycisphaera mikurensis]MBB6440330.1 hypothetical protein [Phycisphaera mikurensis]BAM04288.1 putative oxidoreductase [Phycisphaera mikurensis NBRC 102666]
MQDPRTRFPQPPFENQKPFEMPGSTSKMDPTPDHGESSYTGSGKLKGHRALITGGDSGIGRAVAICYAKEGADVMLNALSESDDLTAAAAECRLHGGKVETSLGDLRQESFCKELVQQTVSKLGGLDVLVNNAAYQEVRESVDDVESELFDRIMKTNVYAPFWLSKEALNHIGAGGSIINTTSIQGFDPTPSLLPYATTKSALLGMTKALAGMAIEKGVRVNSVAPGPVWTPFIPGSMPEAQVQKFGGSTAFGRPAQPVEMAVMYVWLASADASYVTGETFGGTGGKMPL